MSGPLAGVRVGTTVPLTPGACGDWRGALQGDFTSADRVGFSGRYPLACGERTWPVAYVAPRLYAPRVIEAMWLSSGGKLSGQVREEALPRSAAPLALASGEPSIGALLNGVPPTVTTLSSWLPWGTVDSVATPGPAISTSALACEKSARTLLMSMAATDITLA